MGLVAPDYAGAPPNQRTADMLDEAKAALVKRYEEFKRSRK
jgi:hypothetical protein